MHIRVSLKQQKLFPLPGFEPGFYNHHIKNCQSATADFMYYLSSLFVLFSTFQQAVKQ